MCEYMYVVVCIYVCDDRPDCVRCQSQDLLSMLTSHSYTHYTLNMIGTYVVSACHMAQCVVCASIKPACKQCIMALGFTDG